MSLVLRSPDDVRVRLDLDAYCHDCKHWHRLGCTPQGFTDEVWEWDAKHHGHDFEFLSPRRRLPRHYDDRAYQDAGIAPLWLEYAENANLKIAYNASTTITCTLTSLASSATFVAGRECTSIDNSSGLYFDYAITGKVTTGTSPTVNTEIRLYAYAALNDTPTYPDTITGVDATVTLTNTQILENGFMLLGGTTVSGTSNIGYPLGRLLTIAEAFGHARRRWGFFVTHNTVAALHATAGNHLLSHTAAYITST
jgi:hypothetical protein